MAQSKCSFCKKEYQYDTWKEKGMYCSWDCHNKSRIGTLAWNSNTAKPYNKCIDCKEMTSSTKTLRCFSCWNKWRKAEHPYLGMPKLNMRGENHPNWKGGISTQDKLQRAKFRQEMQKAVFERDNYTCQLCGSGGDLQVDHIQKWADYVELRFEMSNLRTLCMNCHYKITYGKEMPENVKAWGHNLERGISKFL